jgi:hypothetical protein
MYIGFPTIVDERVKSKIRVTGVKFPPMNMASLDNDFFGPPIENWVPREK